MTKIRGSITVVDLTDSRQLVAYVSSSNRRQVIYDPNTGEYFPNYSVSPNTLSPELYVAGGGTNIIGQAKSVKWTVQTDSMGAFEDIPATGYSIGTDNSLVVETNVLENNLSMLYRVEIVYTDPGLNKDILIQADMELVKLTNGVKGDEGYTPQKGVDYFDGESGQDGTSSYLWVRYSQNSNGDPMTDDPTNAKYIGVATTETASAPSGYASYTWTLIKGSDGVPGEDGVDGESSYLHIKYSDDGGTTFTANNGEDVGIWIGTYVDDTKADSNVTSDYTWNKVRGDDGYTPIKGVDYFDGVDGQDGNDGKSSYLWVRYSQNSNGNPMTTNPTDAVYVGTAVTESTSAPESYTEYTWVLVKGTDGINGEDGVDGTPSYLHIKYSNDGGATFTGNSGEDVGDWIGTYVNDKQADSNSVDDYTWNKVKGEVGNGIQSITEYYRVHTSKTGITAGGTGWLTTVPTMDETNKFLWNYEEIEHTDGTVVELTARVIGAYGDKGTTGEKGTSIDTIEEFYFTTDTDSGITHSSSGWSETLTAPTPTNKYIWNYEKVTYKNPVSVEDKAPRIIGVYGDKGEKGENAVLLTIETPDGTSIRNSSGTLRAVSELFVGVSPVSSGITHKWYKRSPEATGDSDSGTGWQRLTSTNNFGVTGYDSDTLVVPPEGITGSDTYMNITTYEGIALRRQVTFDDITDPYSVSILGSTYYKNGQGQNTYTAKIYRNGEEIDTNETQGYTYTWHQYSSTGAMISGFEKTGKTIIVTAEEFSGQADLRVTITR